MPSRVRPYPLALALTLAGALAACPKSPEPALTEPVAAAPAPIPYPAAPRGDVVDTYFGVAVPDPYRTLEDPDAPATRTWIDAENLLTRGFIDAVPERAAIHARLTKLFDFDRYSLPTKRAKTRLWSYNDGLQSQSVVMVADGPDGAPRVLLDPNTLSPDGTVSLTGGALSEDGARWAYGVADGGSDWTVWRVRDVATGQDRPDELRWIKFSGVAWTHDGAGFYYARYPEPTAGAALEDVNKNNKLYYHALGTKQAEDRLVFERPDQPEWSFGSGVTEDGKLLVISVSRSTENKNLLYTLDLTKKGAVVTPLVDTWDASYSVIEKIGSKLWVATDLDAPRSRIVQIDLAKPDRAAWTTIVPQTADKLQGVELTGGKLLLTYLHDASSVVKLHALDGAPLGEVALPGIGTVGGFGGRSDDNETFYSFTSFTTPTTIYRYDVATGVSTVSRQPKIDADLSAFTTEQVFYPSVDGTKIPMFLVYRKDLVKDGNSPTMLYGYGGFDIPLTPTFSVANLAWVEMGGVYAVANLRGGGEYGRDWHEQGIKTHKQNVFDDFASAARWLQSNGWTTPARTAISGRSNGGLLVGASVTQHPELFGAALPGVGVLDMLRYHKFTIGWAWAADYGTSEESEEMFRYLLGYSPLHNAKPQRYPPILVTTGDHDDRVVPAHSFKFAAAMQAAQQGPAPVLIRVETRAGHGAGKPTGMVIDEWADMQAFLVQALGFVPLAAPHG